MDSSRGFALLLIEDDEDLEKTAGIGSALRRGFSSASRGTKRGWGAASRGTQRAYAGARKTIKSPVFQRRAALGVGATAIAGGGFAAGRYSGMKGVKVKGGMLYLKPHNHSEFMRILRSQGKIPAARYALGLVKSKAAKFVRGASGAFGMSKTAAEIGREYPGLKPHTVEYLASYVDTIEDTAVMIKEASIWNEAAAKLGGKEAFKAIAKKIPLTMGIGASLAAGGALYGLGGELVDRAYGGVVAGKRAGSKDSRFRKTVGVLQKITPEEYHSDMGIGTGQSTIHGSLDAEYREEVARQTAGNKKRLREAFNLMYKHTPLVTSDPFVTAVVLKDAVLERSGGTFTGDQIQKLLDLEKKMGEVRAMAPFRLRMMGPKGLDPRNFQDALSLTSGL